MKCKPLEKQIPYSSPICISIPSLISFFSREKLNAFKKFGKTNKLCFKLIWETCSFVESLVKRSMNIQARRRAFNMFTSYR